MLRWTSEHRLLFRERKDEIEDTLTGFGQPQPPASLKDIEQRASVLTQQAVLEVKNGAPGWTERIARYVGSKTLGKVVTIDSADKAHVDDAITRATLQASANAEKLLATQADATLAAINTRARQTTNSLEFQKQKLELCTEVSKKLEEELTDVRKRQKEAEGIKAFNRSSLARAVQDLEKRKTVLDSVRADIDANVRGRPEAFVQEEIAQNDDYLRKTIALYLPDQSSKINAMLLEWVEMSASGQDTNGASLKIALNDVAAAMFPGDARRQAQQLAVLERAANKLIARESTWKTYAKKGGVLAASGGALAVGGAMTGGLAIGAGFLTAYALRRYRYGASGQQTLGVANTNTREAWYNQQAASYYRELGVKAGRDVAKLQSIPGLKDRLEALAKLKSGTSFKANGEQLTVIGQRNGLVVVSDSSGEQGSFDVQGDSKGVHVFTFKNGATFSHLSVKTNDTGEDILTIA